MEKKEVLAAYLEADIEDIFESRYDDCLFEYGQQEYLVLEDDEADKKAKEYILDSLWAFNANFIADHTKQGYSTDLEKSIKQVQEKMCESANDMVKALIEDLDEFVADAISSDGRGHFFNTYDGEENEYFTEDGTYYIYRVN